MQEEINNSLISLINKLASGADAVIVFGQEQVPEVLHQLLLWHMTSALMGVLLCVAFFIAAALVFRMAPKYDQYEELRPTLRSELKSTICSLLLLGIIVALIFLYKNLHTALFILLAPKLYLMEYAISLAKGGLI